MSSKRATRGAALGLVAVCVLVLVVIGVGFFFLMKIFGGGREVDNATTSGTINVAKLALRSTEASVPATSDFQGCDDPLYPGQITLLTYNRCVGQTLLVLMNAQNEGTTTAQTNADAAFAQLVALGTSLTGTLKSPATFAADFSNLSGANNMKMNGNNAVNQSDYQTAMMKPGGSSNIYINTAEVPDPTFLTNAGPNNTIFLNNGANVSIQPNANTTAANPDYYVAGYTPMTFANHTIVTVPVFPQAKPHIVGGNDFKSNTFQAPSATGADPNLSTWTPPNAFQVQSQSLDSTSHVMTGNVACAIVGVPLNASGVTLDYPAAFSGGYIQISNAAPTNVSAFTGPTDQSNSIFNNELGNAPGIQVTADSGGDQIFTSNPAQTSGWQAYNASVGTDANGHDPTLAQPTAGMFVAGPGGSYTPATTAQLLTLKAPAPSDVNCYAQLQSNPNGELSAPCSTYLASFEGAYGRSTNASPSPGGDQYSNMDYMKLQLISAFNSHAQSLTVTAPGAKSGMGVLKPSNDGDVQGGNSYAFTQASDMPLEQPTGTAWGMINQIGTNQAAIMASLVIRCNQIKPGTTAAQVQSLLDSVPLLMGHNVYIHLANIHDPSSALVIDGIKPATFVTGSNPDGTLLNGNYVYDLLSEGLIDTISPNGGNGADNNLHERPYRSVDGGPDEGDGSNALSATDNMDWTPSSGYQNLLGQLNFYQTTSGSDSFSRPN